MREPCVRRAVEQQRLPSVEEPALVEFLQQVVDGATVEQASAQPREGRNNVVLQWWSVEIAPGGDQDLMRDAVLDRLALQQLKQLAVGLDLRGALDDLQEL